MPGTAGKDVCVGKGAKGLNEYCYNLGWDHGNWKKLDLHPDPWGDALSVAPCTLKADANKCYGRGYKDSMKQSSPSSSRGSSSSPTFATFQSHDTQDSRVRDLGRAAKLKHPEYHNNSGTLRGHEIAMRHIRANM
jgi:hypothetical protein